MPGGSRTWRAGRPPCAQARAALRRSHRPRGQPPTRGAAAARRDAGARHRAAPWPLVERDRRRIVRDAWRPVPRHRGHGTGPAARSRHWWLCWRARARRRWYSCSDPGDLGNIGAVVRVAAAAGAAGVLVTGRHDPWHPAAVRGGGPPFRLAGCPHRRSAADTTYAGGVDLTGEAWALVPCRRGAVLAFGSERDGLGTDLLGRARRLVTVPMRRGVSSLNLATAVAVTLYAAGQFTISLDTLRKSLKSRSDCCAFAVLHCTVS